MRLKRLVPVSAPRTEEDLVKQQAIFARDKSMFGTHDIPQQTFDVSKAQLEAVRCRTGSSPAAPTRAR